MQGVDFNLQYVMSVGSADTLTFQANGTYLTAYDVAFTPGGAFKDLLNNIYQPLKFKARASVSWDHGPLNARLMLSHVGSYTNDTVAPVQGVGSYTPVDLSLAWRLNESFELGYARSLTLGVEVRNAFDTDPPYVNSRPGANGGGGYDASVASPIGRALAVSLRARF
jgi:iron complex outermembrane receptor protein